MFWRDGTGEEGTDGRSVYQTGMWSMWRMLTQTCYLETGREAAEDRAWGEQGAEGGAREGEKRFRYDIFNCKPLALLVFSKDL